MSEDYFDLERVELHAHIPSQARSVLDVGCGNGRFGAALRQQCPGRVVWGIDIHDASQEAASTNLDHFVLGSFPEVTIERRFDCIVFADSLEHMIDPWSALRSAGELLEPAGTLVLSLPNVRRYTVLRPLLINGDWQYRDSGILDRTHLRFFTRRSGIHLLTECGFEVDEVAAINLMSGGLAARVLKLGGKRCDEFRALQFVFTARVVNDVAGNR